MKEGARLRQRLKERHEKMVMAQKDTATMREFVREFRQEGIEEKLEARRRRRMRMVARMKMRAREE